MNRSLAIATTGTVTATVIAATSTMRREFFTQFLLLIPLADPAIGASETQRRSHPKSRKAGSGPGAVVSRHVTGAGYPMAPVATRRSCEPSSRVYSKWA